MIFVIDGPSGSGKSSTARHVAQKLGLQFLDSGALYRALTLLYVQCEKNQELFFERLNEVKIQFLYENSVFRVWIDSKEVTSELRGMSVASSVSLVASFKESRNFVNNLMRSRAKDNRYIADGRDLGTAVFPDADLKFFMTASLESRAKRRFEELKQSGEDITEEEIRENILKRDNLDSSRDIDPLKKADNAIEIDTSDMKFEEQVDCIVHHIKRYLNP